MGFYGLKHMAFSIIQDTLVVILYFNCFIIQCYILEASDLSQ